MENHTCTAGIDWPGLQPASDLASYLTAAEKVDSSAKMCFLNLNFTYPKGGKSPMPFDVSVSVHKYLPSPLISVCTATDRQMYLRQSAAGIAGSTGYPHVSFGFDDPACASRDHGS